MSRYRSEKVVNNQTSPNALIEKPQNESRGIQNKHGSGGSAQSRIRESGLIEKPDCMLTEWGTSRFPTRMITALASFARQLHARLT